MVEGVDKSKVVEPTLIRDYLGRAMDPQKLSGGVKSLIMLYKEPTILINGNSMSSF
jgi:hypothetical protein